jgi:CheY-like chemotaxis protein
VVDDYPDTCETTAKVLELKGHVAHTATSGHEAILEVSAFDPDLVLLDLSMPDMDGVEVARALRATPGIRKPVIAAMSGYSTLAYKQRCAAAAFDYYLLKPVDPLAIDQLLRFERDAIHERFLALKREQIEINHQFARSQMEYAGIVLDIVGTMRNDATKKRCLDNAQRIKERVGTYLSGEAGISLNQLHALQIALAKLEVRLTAINNLPTPEP